MPILVIWRQKWRNLQFSVVSAKKKSHIFLLFWNSEAYCDFSNKIYISTSDVYMSDTHIVAIWILFATSLYICGKNKEVKICTFSYNFYNNRIVIDFLHHISESCTYFKECHISKGIEHSILQNYSNIFPKIWLWFLGAKVGSYPI